jgi:hypothetical protein
MMNHIDEGTIHGWLDGALDPAQSREIEAHIANCPACAAAVAEARGLIAGASRILIALDDVPAGVTPKRAPAPPTAAKRQWRAAPWVTGIAALLIAAVVLQTTGLERTSADRPLGDVAATMDSARRVEPAVTPPPASVASVPEPTIPRVSARTPRQDAMLAQGGGLASGVATADSAAGADVRMRRATAPPARDERAAEIAAVAPAAPIGPEVGKVDLRGVVSQPTLVERLAGCYRLGEAPAIGKAAPAMESARRSSAAAVAKGALAPSSAQARYASPAPLATVRLDTVLQQAGYLVRALPSDSAIGWWREIGGDSARVNLLSRGVLTFAPKDRVNCPER